MQLYNLTTVLIKKKKKKGGVCVDKMAMFSPFHKNVWANLSTLNTGENKLMQTEERKETIRICIKLVQIVMLFNQRVCLRDRN